ncbi:MAG: leucyl aminopeptidase family protein [bacterium]|nr:leucyl aminopeptidase family protein [bacterium]
MIKIKALTKSTSENNIVLIIDPKGFKKSDALSTEQNTAVKNAIKAETKKIFFNNGSFHTLVIFSEGAVTWKVAELLRKSGAKVCAILNENKSVSVNVLADDTKAALAMAEGIALANYQFLKHKADKKKLSHTLSEINLTNSKITKKEIADLNIIIGATYITRDLVNEPFSHLNAVQLSEEFKKIGKEAGFNVEVWNEAKIEAQKMGGLLAVNKGSKVPPTFNIMEYKPKNAINKKPYVLVGKGVVYDTGGLSLKPTPMSMDYMKCDMAGSAVVAGTMYAVAKAELPIHVIGLVPATDNWIGENSYAPGDVITMYSGATVEVMNTDAEGRIVLADALHYAKKLNPELVCDFATLTGAAVRAIGPYASAILGTADDEIKQDIFDSSYAVFERLVEFPLWDEYADELKSEVADFTNLGKGEGGQISAAKFLEKFTDYPWLHFDIAGPAFNHAQDAYKPKGGTGVGVRLMFDFFSKKAKK